MIGIIVILRPWLCLIYFSGSLACIYWQKILIPVLSSYQRVVKMMKQFPVWARVTVLQWTPITITSLSSMMVLFLQGPRQCLSSPETCLLQSTFRRALSLTTSDSQSHWWRTRSRYECCGHLTWLSHTRIKSFTPARKNGSNLKYRIYSISTRACVLFRKRKKEIYMSDFFFLFFFHPSKI